MSIDSCYEGVVGELTKQKRIVDISKKLLGLTKNYDRVLYVYELIEDLKAFPKVIKVKKNNAVSTYYRNLGNNHFQTNGSHKTEDHKAWQYYNLSLLYAELDTDNYCLALANRSAAFFNLKKYKECLNDIETVLTMKYPEKLKGKLLKRKAACEEELSKKCNTSAPCSEIEEILEFKGPKDSRYKSASTKLEVVFNEALGRHIIAKEDIQVGEVLIEEDPYLCLLIHSQFLICCNHCLSRDLNLMPCDSCCYSLYCSEECKKKAYNEYHKYECPLLATLIHMEFTKLELLSLRILLKARSDHSDWSALFKTIEEAEANENNEFRGHVKEDGNWVYDSKYYASIHTLASNVEKRSVSDIFQKAVTAAVFLRLLNEETDFLKTGNVEEEAKIRKTVAGMLLLHVMTSPINMHSINSNTQNEEGNYVEEMSVGSAPYAFHSLLNHSCSPNTVRFSKLGCGQMKCFALRPIKKGTQLFDNYGSHHALEDLISRLQSLHFQYKFKCQCEACCNNWPTYFGLRPARNLPAKIRKEKECVLSPIAIEKLQKGDKGMALKVYKPLCQLAEQLEPFIPCKELADVQESLKQCLVIFEGLVPNGFNNLVNWSAIPKFKK